MITKEQKINKYCCLYVSDFHLEMILLPFVKNKMDNSKVLVFTQNNLFDSIKILLEKTNLSIESKNEILNIKNWNNKKMDKINNNNNNNNNNENIDEYTIIVNGDEEYRSKINNEIKKLDFCVINLVDCYDINESNVNQREINSKYKGILNTENLY